MKPLFLPDEVSLGQGIRLIDEQGPLVIHALVEPKDIGVLKPQLVEDPVVQGEADVHFAFHDENDLVDLFVFAENLSVWQVLQSLQSLHDFDHEGAVVARILAPPVVRMPHLLSVFRELE